MWQNVKSSISFEQAVHQTRGTLVDLYEVWKIVLLRLPGITEIIFAFQVWLICLIWNKWQRGIKSKRLHVSK